MQWASLLAVPRLPSVPRSFIPLPAFPKEGVTKHAKSHHPRKAHNPPGVVDATGLAPPRFASMRSEVLHPAAVCSKGNA